MYSHTDTMQIPGKIMIEDSNPLKSSNAMSSTSSPDTLAAPSRSSRNQEQYHQFHHHSQVSSVPQQQQHPLQQQQQVIALTENDDSIKMVQIEKSISEPLGATVRNEPDGSVIIGRIVKGGAAEKSGLLHEGDEILEVNGITMKGMNVNQVCDLLAEMTGTLTLVIGVRESMSAVMSPHPGSTIHGQAHLHTDQSQSAFHLRTLFDYDPDDDLYIPCRELGICFTKGDILHVIDQSDGNWWQAYREGESDQTLAGLIPSISFQVQRETIKQSLIQDSSSSMPNNNSNNNRTLSINNNNNLHHGGYYPARANAKSSSGTKSSSSSASMILFNCGKKSHQKRKKRKNQPMSSDGHGPAGAEILTYEEVSLYYPRANIKRPIVLIGPTNIGRQELRQRLMMDTERFAAAVPHTSRSKRDGEIDTIDYHFITRSQFESDIRDGKFVEHGEYEKNYYGTSLTAIEAVVQSGKICVLNLNIHSIPILRQGHAGQYYAVTNKSSFLSLSLDHPQSSLLDQYDLIIDHLSFDLSLFVSGCRLKPYFVFVSPPAHGSVEEAREIEDQYGHYFDLVLKMTDLDRAYEQLLNEINSLDRDPQWIPSDWLK